jgi:DNA-binding transcriptional LysR family regulator
MSAINSDKRKVSSLNIDFIDVKFRMDTKLARTFLTVITSGSVISAADRLHVSQSTVSRRIHALEDQLSCTLFVRNKAGTTLTSAGRQFQRHAATLVRTIGQARHDIGIPEAAAVRWSSVDELACGKNSC